MISNHFKGIASATLAKDLKITQKSAWFVLHRIRHATRSPSFAAPSAGESEADTTFVGDMEKNKHESKRPGSQSGANEAVVVGVVARDGELRTAHFIDA